MSNRIKNNLKNLVGQTLNQYYSKVKPTISDLRYKQEYQNRIIECMVGEVDDNYITTPETDIPIVKLEHSKEGLVKVPSIKGKTILIDADGNETDTPGEGCKLVSVGEEEDNKLIILSKNRNLIDKMIVEDIQQETGSLISNRTGVISGYIKVKPNTNYTLSEQLTATSNWFAIFEYDKNKQLLNYHYNKKMLTSSKTHYVAFKYHNANNISGKFQFEEGNVATPITEQKQHKTEILLDEPLHKGNSIENNQLIKSFNKIFSDREVWTKLNADLENTILFELCINDAKGATSNHELSNITCNRFNTRGASNASGTWGTDIEGISVNTNGRIHLRISKDRLTSLDKNGLMKWFIENPTEILYELAEPIIEELPNGITLQGFDDTTMYIENEITPTVQYGYNALIPYKEELRTQKEEVETNTLDIENNIIPYLMDMEFNLMLMEDNE